MLLVAKPDRFRLRLMLPFGITVFDYLNVGERDLDGAAARRRDPARAHRSSSRRSRATISARRSCAVPMPSRASATPRPAPDERVWVSCREGDALRRTLLIDRDGIVEEASYEDGAPRLVIRYADYRAVDGTSLPFRITLDYPQRQQSVDITIESYEVNPMLSDALFRPLDERRYLV